MRNLYHAFDVHNPVAAERHFQKTHYVFTAPVVSKPDCLGMGTYVTIGDELTFILPDVPDFAITVISESFNFEL